MEKILVNENDSNQTILNFIKKNYKNTKLSIIYKWFRVGKIKINDKRIKDMKVIIQKGDEVLVFDNTPLIVRDDFELIYYPNLKIVYEDSDILIVDKLPNVVVHGEDESLDNQVKSYLYDKGEYNPKSENSFKVSHVHRIDKLTFGLVLYAKTKKAMSYFLANINNKDMIKKVYLAVTEKEYFGPQIVEGFIKHNNDLKISQFTLEEIEGYAKCSCKIIKHKPTELAIQLYTGKKHQIRSILAFYDARIENDIKYGAKKVAKEFYINLNSNMLVFNNMTEGFEYLNGKAFKSTININDKI